jgi:hypothetical protein
LSAIMISGFMNEHTDWLAIYLKAIMTT